MLRGVDRALELAGWALALMLAIMMFVGPQVVAEDKPAGEGGESAGAAPYANQASSGGGSGTAADEGGGGGEGASADGEAVFADNCGSCHTLSAAGTSGSVGPNLDDTSLDASAIEGIVSDGTGSMPAFGGALSEDEIAAVAEFVAGAN